MKLVPAVLATGFMAVVFALPAAALPISFVSHSATGSVSAQADGFLPDQDMDATTTPSDLTMATQAFSGTPGTSGYSALAGANSYVVLYPSAIQFFATVHAECMPAINQFVCSGSASADLDSTVVLRLEEPAVQLEWQVIAIPGYAGTFSLSVTDLDSGASFLDVVDPSTFPGPYGITQVTGSVGDRIQIRTTGSVSGSRAGKYEMLPRLTFGTLPVPEPRIPLLLATALVALLAFRSGARRRSAPLNSRPQDL